MRHGKWTGAVLAAAMLLSQVPVVPALADEIIAGEDEVIDVEEMEIPEDELSGGDSTTVVTYEAGQDEEGVTQDELSFDQLIEDGGIEVVTVSDGADYQEVLTAESEADAAAEKVRELMDGVPLMLESADPARISTYLQELKKVPSPIGSDGELEIGAYIEETMRSFGYTVSKQNFHEGFLNRDYVDMPGVNIIAERGANGRLADRTQEIILIGCHYDSRTDPDEEDPLANDKNGAAAVLECARILSMADSNVDLCFLFFSGEEDGYFGSARLVEGLSEEIRQRIKCMIYVGPVGYVLKREALQQNRQEETETETETAEMTENPEALAAEKADPGKVLPLLIGVPTQESNDPANLLRALGLYRDAEELLMGDALLLAGSGETQSAQTETAATGGQMPSADSAVQGQGPASEAALSWRAYTPAQWKEFAERREAYLAAHPAAEPAQETAEPRQESEGSETVNEEMASENLQMLQGLDDWTRVAGAEKYLLNFNDNGIVAAGIFQPVDTGCTRGTLLQPVAEDMEEPAAETSAGTGSDSAADDGSQVSVSAAVGAEQVSDILMQAGAGTEGTETAEEEQERIIPVADPGEIARTADFLASAISLYMRSQTSISLG